MGIKALTIKQPWASLIVHGIKDIESRSWTTDYRGRLLIHAGASLDTSDEAKQSSLLLPRGADMPRKCVVGAVILSDVVSDSSSKWADAGCYHWVLGDPIVFTRPVPCRGLLGLWVPSDEVFSDCKSSPFVRKVS